MWCSKLTVLCFLVLLSSFAYTLPTEKKTDDKDTLIKLKDDKEPTVDLVQIKDDKEPSSVLVKLKDEKEQTADLLNLKDTKEPAADLLNLKITEEKPSETTSSVEAELTPPLLEVAKPYEDDDDDDDDELKPSEIKPSSSSNWYEKEPTAIKPTDLKPNTESGSLPSPSTPDAPTPPRRQVQYDQRQDGKYNIRADLENFVILVVPSSGNSLLDLLRRSSPARHHPQLKGNHNQKHHKKYYGAAEKAAGAATKKNQHRLDYLRPELHELPEVHSQVGSFIEGRTPYHVDISSSEILQPAVAVPMENQQPLKISELRSKIANHVLRSIMQPSIISDIPLEIEPMVAEAAEEAAVLVPVIKGNQNPRNSMASILYPRYRKSLTIEGNGNNNINTNSVILTSIPSEIRNDEYDSGVGGESDKNNNLMANAEYINLSDPNGSFDSLNVDNIDRLALAGGETKTNNQWELTLLGAQEQCGPDRRRDSYGICQFVPPDYASS